MHRLLQPWRWSAALLLVAFATGCSPGRAYTEWVARTPEPVRFGCATAGAPADQPGLPVPVIVNEVLAGPDLPAVAGNLNQHPDSIYVPFSDATRPLHVFRTDVARILESRRTATDENADASPRQLDATLLLAYVDRTFHVWKSSEMRGRVIFEFSIFDPQTGRTDWTQRIAEEYRARPGYITSRSVEEALNGAYCQALAAFGEALRSAELRASLGP